MKKGKVCRRASRRDGYTGAGRFPLSGLAGLMVLAMLTVLIPACQESRKSDFPDSSREGRLPAALRG